MSCPGLRCDNHIPLPEPARRFAGSAAPASLPERGQTMNNRAIVSAVAVVIVAAVLCVAYVTLSDDRDHGQSPDDGQTVPPADGPDSTDDPDDPADSPKVLIAYFSRTSTTESYAEQLQSLTGGDIVRIETKDPYPSDYQTTTEVARAELDANARPEITTHVDDMDSYDIILVGFPIWWGAPPMAVLTFLEDYDLSGKTVVTFCTSVSSPISGSTEYIRGSIGSAELIQGVRMTASMDLEGWLGSLDIPVKG